MKNHIKAYKKIENKYGCFYIEVDLIRDLVWKSLYLCCQRH